MKQVERASGSSALKGEGNWGTASEGIIHDARSGVAPGLQDVALDQAARLARIALPAREIDPLFNSLLIQRAASTT